MAESAEDRAAQPKKPRLRSPNYPGVSLENALALVGKQHESDGLQRIPANIAHRRWGYAPNTSRAQIREAALKAYGLIKVIGLGKTRSIKVTETADKIIRQHPEWSNILKEVALSPTIHREVWEHYNGNLPQDDVFQQFLVWSKGFNDKSVYKFISQYRETIAFAGLGEGEILESETGSSDTTETTNDGMGASPLGGPSIAIAPEPAVVVASTSGPSVGVCQDYSIPRMGGRLAVLRLEYPVSQADIEQIRRWLDLMGNALGDESAAQEGVEGDV